MSFGTEVIPSVVIGWLLQKHDTAASSIILVEKQSFLDHQVVHNSVLLRANVVVGGSDT